MGIWWWAETVTTKRRVCEASVIIATVNTRLGDLQARAVRGRIHGSLRPSPLPHRCIPHPAMRQNDHQDLRDQEKEVKKQESHHLLQTLLQQDEHREEREEDHFQESSTDNHQEQSRTEHAQSHEPEDGQCQDEEPEQHAKRSHLVAERPMAVVVNTNDPEAEEDLHNCAGGHSQALLDHRHLYQRSPRPSLHLDGGVM